MILSNFGSMAEDIAKLKEEIRELRKQLERETGSTDKTGRVKIDQMSSEVVDSNPYSRLMALKRMGIVQNYEVK